MDAYFKADLKFVQVKQQAELSQGVFECSEWVPELLGEVSISLNTHRAFDEGPRPGVFSFWVHSFTTEIFCIKILHYSVTAGTAQSSTQICHYPF